MTAGVNTTAAEQLAPAARLAPQFVCVMLKGAVTVSLSPLALTLPVLLMVTVWAALACPRVASVKVICPGLTFNPDAVMPVPLSPTETAFTPSVAVETVSTAAFPPTASGVKITCTVQLAPFVSVAPQFDVPVEKLPACEPVIWKPTCAIGDPPLLLTVSVSGALAAASCCVAKFSCDGLTPIAAGCSPVPISATVCVPSASLTVSVPLWLPVCMGEKITLMAQLEWAASVVPQLFEV